MRISDWSSDVCSSDLSTLAIGSLTSLNACGAVTGGVVTGLPSSSLCSRLRIWVLVGTPASSAMATAVRTASSSSCRAKDRDSTLSLSRPGLGKRYLCSRGKDRKSEGEGKDGYVRG